MEGDQQQSKNTYSQNVSYTLSKQGHVFFIQVSEEKLYQIYYYPINQNKNKGYL